MLLLTGLGSPPFSVGQNEPKMTRPGVRYVLPGIPYATITMLGPMASFHSSRSKVKTYSGDDCGGAGIPGLYVPIVGAIGSAAIHNAELGIGVNPTFQSHWLPVTDTFADLTDWNEPAVAGSGYGAINDIWKDCENWREIMKTLRGMADVICADGTELWATCIPPPDTPQRIVFADGDLELLAGNHMGIFAVTGQISVSGNANVNGLILAVGEGSYRGIGNGNGVVSGAVIVADIAGPDNIYGNTDDCSGPGTGDNEGFDTPTYSEAAGSNSETVYCTTDISASWPTQFYEIGPVDLLDALIDRVTSLGLHHGIENSLLAKLNAASLILTDLQANNDLAAANVLGAFINHVQAQYGKKIASEDADALIEAAEEIIALLNQSESASRQRVASPRLFSPAGRRQGGRRPQEPE